MKLKNTTDFPNHFLRRLISWCCRKLGLPARKLREATFRKRSRGWSGRAYWRSRIGIRIAGDDLNHEVANKRFSDGFQVTTADRIEVLVLAVAHELAHIEQFWRLGNVRSKLERHTEGQAFRLLVLFRDNRESLIAEWSAAPAKRPIPVVPVQERRQAVVLAALGRWQRKLKLARTKVAAYQRKARYYEKAIAARKGGAT